MPGQTPAAHLAAMLEKRLEKMPLTLPEKAEARRIIGRLKAAGTTARAAKTLLSKAKRLPKKPSPTSLALLKAVVRVDPKPRSFQLARALAEAAWQIILRAAKAASQKVAAAASYVAAALKTGLVRAVTWLADHTYIEWAAKTLDTVPGFIFILLKRKCTRSY